ncbi:SRPBCC family protein [Nocardia sp. AG03]|uniref:SRPBCC family protein n=1 Tax=Nocardia sp. AG03 TaxID=3025312 RepID=UPI00241889CA|nr:SRPBCC family protein [Nocardia sp. AG03]
MAEVSKEIPVAAEEVFAVLADGWSYASWVVGASHIRDVDADWPEVGSKIRHSVGPWPLTIQDSTSVRALDRPHSLELDARLWPLGAAIVRLDVRATGPATCEVIMNEWAVRGPGTLLPDPLETMLLTPRNRESLSRLADLAVGGYLRH